MKFFGWGRKKDPSPIQPTPHVEVKTSDDAPPRNLRPFGSSLRWGSRDDTVLGREQGGSSSLPRTSQDKDFEALAKEMAESGVAWEDRLQETIRFVFSHEQEGLLAIGTFALDQLAGVRLGLDINRLKPSPATPATPATPTILPATPTLPVDHESSVSSIQVALRSSDDEREMQHCCKRKELPVSGDNDALSALHSGVVTTNPRPVHILKPNPSCTGTSITNSPDHDQSDEEFHMPGVCGLFGSRSRRTQKVGEKEKRKKMPPEKRVGNKEEQQCAVLQIRATGSPKKADRAKGSSSKRRLWHPPAEVTPEPETSATAARNSPQVSGVPCIANVDLEGRVFREDLPSQPLESSRSAGAGGERKIVHSFGTGTWACGQNGKWIRTDSEFVVLEM